MLPPSLLTVTSAMRKRSCGAWQLPGSGGGGAPPSTDEAGTSSSGSDIGLTGMPAAVSQEGVPGQTGQAPQSPVQVMQFSAPVHWKSPHTAGVAGPLMPPLIPGELFPLAPLPPPPT